MSGRYKHQSRQFILRFEDMPGLEVVMRPVSVGKLMDLAGLADDFVTGKATPGQITELFDGFADRIVSWNLDVDDQEVPADMAGVRTLDADLFMQIFNGWFEGMTQAPKASPETPPDGVHPEASLPMETLPSGPSR
jgi:hypothetical protein